jgi:predicted transcriptional regulator
MTRAPSWTLALATLLCLAPSVHALGDVHLSVPVQGVPATALDVDPALPLLHAKLPGVHVDLGADPAPPPAAPVRALSTAARGAPQALSLAETVGSATFLAVLLAGLLGGVDGLRRIAAGLLGLGTALFSRIQGERILENPVRQRVLETIRAGPGVCIGEVRDRTGVAWGTAVYHLHRLERTGVVVSVRQKGARRYFAANTPVSRHRGDIAALAHPTAQRIAQLVHQRPGIDQSGVCRALGLLNPAASKHLGRLQALGLVAAERAGRSRLYQGTPALEQALNALGTSAAPEAPAAVLVDAAVAAAVDAMPPVLEAAEALGVPSA